MSMSTYAEAAVFAHVERAVWRKGESREEFYARIADDIGVAPRLVELAYLEIERRDGDADAAAYEFL